MTKDEARYAALRTFVGLEQRKEECRDMRRVRFIEDIWQDLHYGVRILRKNPGFTAVATLTLALGIGANTAIFSVVDAVLFRPLPFEASDRLLMVAMANPQLGESRLPFSVADFLDWQEQNQVFDDLAAFTDNWLSLTGNAEPERVRGAYVTAGFFTTLRAQALMGRTFAAGDDAPGRDSLVVLSHQLWQRRFNSDPQVVGQAVTLSGRSRTIIGVMPDSFQFPPDDKTSLPGKVDLWVPHTLNPPARRGPYYLWGIARLRPGTTPENAQAELESIGLRIRDANPLTNAATTFVAVSLKDAMVGDVRRVLLVLLGAVAFVLLIASTNVANLSLARAAARQREIAIRTALGARRARITRQFLTESLLLAGLGAALGFALAFWLTHLLTTLGPGSLPRLAEVKIDYRVFGYTGAVTVLSGMLFGMAPAWHGSRTNLNESLKEGSRSTAESRGWQHTRSLLVIGELALSLVLLVGAGLMLNSLLRLQRVSPGFEPLNILTMEINLPSVRYKEEHQINGFYHE